VSWRRPLIFIGVVVALLGVRALLTTAPTDNLRDGDGYLYIARGGPVIVGFQSDTPASLDIAGKHLQGRGVVKDRIVLPAGPQRIHVTGNARLVWSPVGRRGDPEYVPASSLSPTETGFGRFVGASPLDGVIALLLLAAIVVFATHRSLVAVSRETWFAIGGVVALALGVRLIGLWSFGQTWDEDVNWAAGRNYVTNLLSLDFRASSWTWNYEHPPIMKYLEGIGAQFADGFGPARALSAIWTSIGCALLVPIGARLYSHRVGILAAVIAALLPPLVAHGQIVGHESPTVLWWSLAILLALRVNDDPALAWRRLVSVGIVIGLAVASRFVNGLVGVLAIAIIVIQSREPAKALVRSLVMAPIALATLYVVWPRLWLHPILALRASFAKLAQPHSPEPFLGAMTNHPGVHYFLVYLAATLPLLILLGVVAYAVRANKERNRAALVMLAWFVVPLAVAFSPVRQDGVRYVMPCVLALAMMSAAGVDFVARQYARFAVPVVALYLAVTLVRIHPYYLDYFGEQVGGPKTVAAHRWFETAWWGEGVDRAVDYVNTHAAPNARVFRNCIEPYHLAWFREDLWTPMTNNPAEADWIVTYAPTSRACPLPPQFHRVFTVDAQGATLAEVWTR
jgi:4-amino-4-deoxy-L-arabinose transferase-like glycosyltransferase